MALFIASAAFSQSSPDMTLRIVEPPDDTVVSPHTNLVVEAVVGGTVKPAKVEFYANTKFIGSAEQPPYSVTWKGVPEGSSFLRARVHEGTNTVESAPVRVRAHYWGKLFTFGLDKVEGLQPKVLGNPLWKYVASAVYIILALVAVTLADLLTRILLKRWASAGKTEFGLLVIDLFKGPVRLIAFIIVAEIGLQVFPLPIWAERWSITLLSLAMAAAVTYVALQFVDLAVSHWKRRVAGQDDRSIEEHIFPLVRKTAKVFVIIIAVLFTCQNVFQKDITTILASLSIGGLAIGLAAQDTLGDLFGAMSIFVDKAFRIGDGIKLNSIEGTVESIGLRSTKVRSPEGFLITIPNKTMGSATITNLSSRPTIKTDINFGVPYDLSSAQIDRAAVILREVFTKHPMSKDVVVSVNKFAESWVNILVSHTWNSSDYSAYLHGLQEMNLETKRRFDEEGIGFAVSSRTVRLRRPPPPPAHGN